MSRLYASPCTAALVALVLAGCQGEPANLPVVRGLTAGDRACYVELEDAAGQVTEAEASFEICERTDLVGQRVRLTRESAAIMAGACQGDPECALRDTVDLIVGAEPAP